MIRNVTGLHRGTNSVSIIQFQQYSLGAYTCSSSWIKCKNFWFYRCPVYQVLHQVAEDLDTN